jgi:PhnB protein
MKNAPKGYRTLNCHLVVREGLRALDFYIRAFGAREKFRLVEPSGKLGHAELEIGDSVFMLADEYPDFGALSPATIGGCPVKFQIYVDDAGAAMKRAVDAGATEVRAVKDEFYGDRVGMVADPFGYSWSFAQRIEEVSVEEMQKRFAAVLAG